MGNRHVVERFVDATNRGDVDAEVALLHPDFVGRYPQSGEVIRGPENYRRIAEQYPGRDTGSLTTTTAAIMGADDKWVSRPSWPAWTLVHVSGSDDEFAFAGLVHYPNGDTWHAVSLVTMKDGKIWRATFYFAEPFEVPEWRRPFVEIELPTPAERSS